MFFTYVSYINCCKTFSARTPHKSNATFFYNNSKFITTAPFFTSLPQRANSHVRLSDCFIDAILDAWTHNLRFTRSQHWPTKPWQLSCQTVKISTYVLPPWVYCHVSFCLDSLRSSLDQMSINKKYEPYVFRIHHTPKLKMSHTQLSECTVCLASIVWARFGPYNKQCVLKVAWLGPESVCYPRRVPMVTACYLLVTEVVLWWEDVQHSSSHKSVTY